MNFKKILSYGMIPAMAVAFQFAEPPQITAQELSKIEHKLVSIDPICQRNIKMAGKQIQQLMEEYPFAVRDRNEAYITGKENSSKMAEERLKRLESELDIYIKTIGNCRKPQNKEIISIPLYR